MPDLFNPIPVHVPDMEKLCPCGEREAEYLIYREYLNETGTLARDGVRFLCECCAHKVETDTPAPDHRRYTVQSLRLLTVGQAERLCKHGAPGNVDERNDLASAFNTARLKWLVEGFTEERRRVRRNMCYRPGKKSR